MKQLIQGIFAILINSLVFLTTSGFYVNEYICLKSGQVQTSLSLDSNEGSMFSVSLSDHLICTKKGCCHKTTKFYKICNPFETSQFHRLNAIQPIIEKTSDFIISEHFISLEDTDIAQNINAPPLIPKQFIYLTHQTKLAPPLI